MISCAHADKCRNDALRYMGMRFGGKPPSQARMCDDCPTWRALQAAYDPNIDNKSRVIHAS